MAKKKKRRKKVIPQRAYKPPKLKDKFPICFNYSDKTESLWSANFKIDDDALISNFATLLNQDFNRIGKATSPVDLNVIIHDIFDEIIKVKSSYTGENKRKIAFLQLCWGLYASTAYNSWNELHYNYEFFVKSLFDEVYEDGYEFTFDTDLITYYLDWSKEEIYASNDIIENWLDQLFFYSERFGGLNDWCETFQFLVLEHLYSRTDVKEHYISLISHVYSWADQNNEKDTMEILSRELEGFDGKVSWKENEVKSLIALIKLLLSNHYLDQKEDIYKELKKEGALNSIQQLQALTSLLRDVTKIDKYLKELMNAITQYNASIEGNKGLGVIRNAYIKSRTFSNILGSTINDAVKFGRSDVITDLITHFFNPDEKKISDNIIYVVPNHKEGIVYCFNKDSVRKDQETNPLIEKAIEIENQLFNSKLVLRGASDQKFYHYGQVIGKPNKKFGHSFELALNDIYNFDLLEDESTSKIESICQFSFNSWPIQALILKNIGATFPINLSFRNKKKYPESLKILFWKGTSYTSALEAELVKEIFGENNIKVLSADDSNKEEFLNEVSSQNYNLIWISSHGEHEHYEPNKSSITLSDEVKIHLEDYKRLKTNSDSRTLFFFNICEGGVHAQISEFKNIGFANLICDNSQDVLSHLWMVDPLIALLFGIIFSKKLVEDPDYFSSYSATVAVFIQGKDSVINELNFKDGECAQIFEMIERRDDLDWNNILHWGSSVYYI